MQVHNEITIKTNLNCGKSAKECPTKENMYSFLEFFSFIVSDFLGPKLSS